MLEKQEDLHEKNSVFSIDPDQMNDEISLLDIAISLAKYKKAIFGVPFIVAFIVAIITLFIPNTYKATASLVMTGGAVPKDFVVSIIQSKPMSDSIIKKFDLKQHYNVLNNFKARKILGNNVDTGFDKYGLLNISVTDSNPQFAYRIAQAYEQNLASFIRLYSFTESSRRRIYFERQLPEVKKSLEEARNKLKIAEHYSNITSSDSRVVTLLKKSAEFKAKIAMKELELEFMQSLNMTSNPNYLRSQEELNGLWIEFGNVAQNDIASFKISLKDNEYLSSLQSFEYAETRYEQLIKLIEKAKLDERLDIPVIQVVSAVEIPQEKTGPNRLLIVELCMAVTFFITIIWAFIAESFQQIKSDPRSSSQLEALKRAARWK